MRHQSRSYAVQALYQSEMLQSKSMLHCDRFLEQLETTDETCLLYTSDAADDW